MTTAAIGLAGRRITVTPSAVVMTSGAMTGLSERVTASIRDKYGNVIPYTRNSLTWSSTNAHVPVTDNLDGSATIRALAGSQSATIMCLVTKTIGTPTVIGAGLTLTTAAPAVTHMTASLSTVHLTARGQVQSVTVASQDQYGANIP